MGMDISFRKSFESSFFTYSHLSKLNTLALLYYDAVIRRKTHANVILDATIHHSKGKYMLSAALTDKKNKTSKLKYEEIKRVAMIRNNTIKSHIPPSTPKGKEAHTKTDKRSRNRKPNEELFLKQLIIQ